MRVARRVDRRIGGASHLKECSWQKAQLPEEVCERVARIDVGTRDSFSARLI
jgi:hypothetical protein